MKSFAVAGACMALALFNLVIGNRATPATLLAANVLLLVAGILILTRGVLARQALLGAQNREAELKQQLEAARAKSAATSAPAPVAAPSPVASVRPEVVNAELVGFLSLLQSKGRLVDFLMDDITPYSDAEVGAAARVVHQGCSSVLKEYFDIAPLGTEPEGSAITLNGELNPKQYRLVGHAPTQAPFRGTVLHRGWRTRKVSLPRVSGTGSVDCDVIAPAEIELS